VGRYITGLCHIISYFCSSDDRGYLLREIKNLQKIHDKDVRTTELLKQEMVAVRDKVNQLASSSNSGNDISRRKTVHSKQTTTKENQPSTRKEVSFKRTLSDPKVKVPSSSNSQRTYDLPTTDVNSISTRTSLAPHKQLKGRSGTNSDIGVIKSNHTGISRATDVATSHTTAVSSTTSSKEKPYHDTGGRKRAVRELLDGHECEECKRYFRVMEEQGLIKDENDLRETLRKCSRHKCRYTCNMLRGYF
jgi:hypothetical protein